MSAASSSSIAQAIAKRDAGTAILLVSAELDEVLELSDRIAVMYRGRLVAVLDGRDRGQERRRRCSWRRADETAEAAPAAAAPGCRPDAPA